MPETASKNSTRFQALCESVEHDLLGRFRVGERLPSERQLARTFGVSPVTIARVLQKLSTDGVLYRVPSSGSFLCENQPVRVAHVPLTVDQPARKPETRSVSAAAGETRGPAVAAAPSLAGKQIAVIAQLNRYSPGLENEGHARHMTVSCLERLIQLLGGSTTLVNTENYLSEAIPEAVERLVQRGVGGIIVLLEEKHEHNIWMMEILRQQFLAETPICISYIRTSPGDQWPFNSVTLDSAHGMFEAVRHLKNLGHRRIWYMGLDDAYTGRWHARRVEAFRRAMFVSGLDVPSGAIISSNSGTGDCLWPVIGCDCANQLMAFDELPTAVIAANDQMAIPFIERLTECSHRAARQLSVVGFDDTHDALLVGLTTFHVPTYEVANEAVRLLSISNSSGLGESILDVAIRPTIVIRTSTFAPMS